MTKFTLSAGLNRKIKTFMKKFGFDCYRLDGLDELIFENDKEKEFVIRDFARGGPGWCRWAEIHIGILAELLGQAIDGPKDPVPKDRRRR